MNYRSTKIALSSLLSFSFIIFSMQKDDGSTLNWPTTVTNKSDFPAKVWYIKRGEAPSLGSREIGPTETQTFLCAAVYLIKVSEHETLNWLQLKATKTVIIHPPTKEAGTTSITPYPKSRFDFWKPPESTYQRVTLYCQLP